MAEQVSEVKPGLNLITTDLGGGVKKLTFQNTTADTQFKLGYEFQEAEITNLAGATVDGPKTCISLYPGEKKEFVQGKWKGFKRSIGSGPPDKAFQEKAAAATSGAVDGEIAKLKEVLKASPPPDGKFTADYIASVCSAKKIMFVDLTFPPRGTSIAKEGEGAAPAYSWQRPSAYCTPQQKPCVFVDKIEPNDIDQGKLGDCYFMCSLACISEFPKVVESVFNEKQEPEYGIYRVMLCKNGWWQPVVLDDFVPTQNSVPVFAKNREEPNELWVSLLEKAYAKLHGSYFSIRSGDAAQAMADLIGCPYKKFKSFPEWESDKDAFFKLLQTFDERDYLMAIGTPGVDHASEGKGGTDALSQKYEAVGLATGHAYSLIRVKEVQGHRLCMIRNPWGNDKEWTGDWGDNSPLWTDEIKAAVGFYAGNDGTYWMAWHDVLKWFDSGSVCILNKEWSEVRVQGNFETGVSDLSIQITVKKDVSCWFGVHQRDNRGLPADDKDKKYAGVVLTVLAEKDGGALEKICATENGTYMAARDVSCEAKLTARPKPYYVHPQGYSDDINKSFVVSIYIEDPTAVEVVFYTYKTKPARYNPLTKFKTAEWASKTAANYQIKGSIVDLNKPMTILQGEKVDWKFRAKHGPQPTLAIK
eukprot:PhF_6_TR20521/c0_g1_i1/m.29599/K08582/CAPN15; calpain-15